MIYKHNISITFGSVSLTGDGWYFTESIAATDETGWQATKLVDDGVELENAGGERGSRSFSLCKDFGSYAEAVSAGLALSAAVRAQGDAVLTITAPTDSGTYTDRTPHAAPVSVFQDVQLGGQIAYRLTMTYNFIYTR